MKAIIRIDALKASQRAALKATLYVTQYGAPDQLDGAYNRSSKRATAIRRRRAVKAV